jgi:hypothetical protein
MAGAPATDSAAAATGAAAVPLLLPLDDAVAGGGCWEDAAISLGLVGVQLASAAYMVVLTPVLALGLDPLFLIAFGSLCTGILTVPFAVKLERFELITRRHGLFVIFCTFADRSANPGWTEQEEMAVGADQPALFPVRRAGSGRVRNPSNAAMPMVCCCCSDPK